MRFGEKCDKTAFSKGTGMRGGKMQTINTKKGQKRK